MIKVRCTTNRVDRLPEGPAKRRAQENIRVEGPIDPLEVGRIYDVCALETWRDGGLRLYLHTTDGLHFPSPYPAEFFEFVDSRFPPGWKVGVGATEGGTTMKRVSFPEWVDDEHFYERLVVGDTAAIRVYERWRETIRTLEENFV